jgi:cyclopropane-fatty-acyl-phospholipid synthase
MNAEIMVADGTRVPDGLVLPRPGRSRRLHRALAPVARRVAHRVLRRLERGGITLVEGDTIHRVGRASREPPLHVTIQVRDPRVYSSLILRGSVGAAESYLAGHWDCSDLTTLARILARNPRLGEGLLHDAGARVVRPWVWLAHRARRNTASQGRRNVAAHYDLGNEFFELFLDRSLTYSCAIFESDEDTLESAQLAKLDRICRKLQLRPGLRLLEIGTGWGGLAIHAARHYGCQVVTTTNSRAQFEFARQLVRANGLSQAVTVLNDDYRDVRGEFDRLVAVEMIEAVGARFLETFFTACSRLLTPEGLMLLQAILTPDPSYASSLRSVDFIKHYVFPGGQLPSVGAMCTAIARRTDLRLTQFEDLTPHYATTLRHWSTRLARNRARVAALGYPDAFLRLWELYLHSCEGYFREAVIGVAQIAFAKPGWRTPIAPHDSRAHR